MSSDKVSAMYPDCTSIRANRSMRAANGLRYLYDLGRRGAPGGQEEDVSGRGYS